MSITSFNINYFTDDHLHEVLENLHDMWKGLNQILEKSSREEDDVNCILGNRLRFKLS